MNTTMQLLNEDWRFYLGECENAWYKGFDDREWKKVMLPHDWSVEMPFSKSCSSGTGYLTGGIGWYRGWFTVPEEYKGKQIRIVFDGVYKNSQVWCNSYYLGKRPSGYTTFSYDITDRVCFGEDKNEISVKVTHTDIADSRWFTGSGVTRKVYLVIEEAVHPAEYGCTFSAFNINNTEYNANAQIAVKHEIVNADTEEKELMIETILYDESGCAVTKLKGSKHLLAESEAEVILTEDMEQVKLWSPESPYLYRMESWYQVDQGEKYLVHSEKVGVRSIEFRPDEGFFLNNKEIKIKGVCVHHDGGCLGAAMKKEVWQRRLELLKQCGCNAIRCSHNPHMPELYELCDTMGFLMMDEAFDEWENAKNKWSTGHNVYPPKHQGYFEDFPQWHEADLRAMVRRDRNHPSVILWSIGNEIDYPNDPYCHPMFTTMTGNNDANKPAAERQYDANKPNMERLTVIAKELVHIVKSEDMTRPVTVAAAFPELSSRLGFIDELDVVGYNYKEHLYEEDHIRFPEKTFLGSENSHSYEAWKAVTVHPYICGQFLWTGIDYLGEAKGWPVHGSSAGIITTAGFAKPEFYKRASYWQDKKMLQLATRKAEDKDKWVPMTYNWNYEEGTKVQVKCYASSYRRGNYVILYCNGKQIGTSAEYDENGEFVFETDYEPGILEAAYYNENDELVNTSKLETTRNASVMEVNLYKETDLLSGMPWKECSKQKGYLYQLLIRLKDKDDKQVVWDDREITIKVEGAGEFAGMDNGNLADVTPFMNVCRKTYYGNMVAYIRRTDVGAIKLRLEMNSNKEESGNESSGDISYEVELV